MASSPADLSYTEDDAVEEIEMTPAQLYKKLKEAWLNEKFAPDLLEHQSDIVDCTIDQINGMEENIKRVGKGNMRAAVHNMEIDRIRYMLTSYLRCRLKKIENFHISFLQRDENSSRDDMELRMSPAERQFCLRYKTSLDDHLKFVLNRMPPNMQTLEDSKIAIHPDLHQYVFLKVIQECDGILVSEVGDATREETVDLKPGDQHIIPFKSVASSVANGSVLLI